MCSKAKHRRVRGTLSTVLRTSDALKSSPLAIKKGLVFDMLPEKLSYGDRCKLARDVGFEVVQMPTEPDAGKAQEIKKAADSGGIHIDSVMNMVHWKYPLSSADHAVVEKSLAGMRTSLHNAKLGGQIRSCSCREWLIRRPPTMTHGCARKSRFVP